MNQKKLSLGALKVETFPTDDEVMMRPVYETERNYFTCAVFGCTYEAPCI